MKVVESKSWRAIAASVPGTSHTKQGQPCQDDYHWDILPDNVLVAAVADGAGSAPLGQVGAAVAVRAAVEAAVRLTSTSQSLSPWKCGASRSPQIEAAAPIGAAYEGGWESLLANALEQALTAVLVKAEDLNASARDLACTLILVVAAGDLVVAAQVGDGAVVIGDGDDKITSLTVPDRGVHANETTFLISPNALETAQIKVWQGAIAHLAIFSDGLQRLALNMQSGSPHEPFFSPLFRFTAQVTDETVAEEELMGFLQSPRVTQRTDDDLTLLLAAFV